MSREIEGEEGDEDNRDGVSRSNRLRPQDDDLGFNRLQRGAVTWRQSITVQNEIKNQVYV